MGYAQIAGLPAVYGLYGSVLPILFFAMFSTSFQIIFGIDAAPAALVGSFLASQGIEAASKEALAAVPKIAFLTAVWLFLFSIFKAGRLIKYISGSVIGGFVSGIACSIILMQIPKLMGGTAGTGEFLQIAVHLISSFEKIQLPSFLLGMVSLCIIFLLRKWAPKVPGPVVIMILGALLQFLFHLDRYGIALLPKVVQELPAFFLPSFSFKTILGNLGISLTVAVVILSETLLTSNDLALKNKYTIRPGREIFAYAIGNLISALTGNCPVNGSISRTKMSEKYKGKTQAVSLTAGIGMIFVLLFGTKIIGYLPVPVLTAIIIFALYNVLDIDLAVRLYKLDKGELFIFLSAFVGVVLLGTIYGVLLGVALSFISILRKETVPHREFLGVIPGYSGFFSLKRNRNSRPISQVVIYRFNSNLFFANVSVFAEDIEASIKADTKVVIVDASAITDIDLAAVDRLRLLYNSLKQRGIRFYLTEHIGELNDKLKKIGCHQMMRDGVFRRTIKIALADAGFVRPFVLEEGGEDSREQTDLHKSIISEFEWAFGDQADQEMENYISRYLQDTGKKMETVQQPEKAVGGIKLWHNIGKVEEDDILEHLELHISELAEKFSIKEEVLWKEISRRRENIETNLKAENPHAALMLKKHRRELDALMQRRHRQIYDQMIQRRKQYKTDRKKGIKH